MTKIYDVIAVIEEFAPGAFQVSYDNSGLQVGNKNDKVQGVLICVDVTEKIIEEAIRKKTNLIISHHPLIFSGLKRITGSNSVERIVEQCIKHNIALYAAHTNLDSVQQGVSYKLASAIGLEDVKILDPVRGALSKLVTFVSKEYSALVREALFKAGAGNIGQYDKCSYNLEGKGTFRGSDATQPFVGKKEQLHTEAETRIETIFPNHIKAQVLRALLENHPYEEVAYDIYPIDNEWPQVGMGAIGKLPKPMDAFAFLKQLKKKLGNPSVRHTTPPDTEIKIIAVCGGSGSFLLKKARAEGADLFISADFKYHQFFEAENGLMIADIGHYESEQFTKDIFYDLLMKNFTTFAIHLTEINTNPINYL